MVWLLDGDKSLTNVLRRFDRVYRRVTDRHTESADRPFIYEVWRIGVRQWIHSSNPCHDYHEQQQEQDGGSAGAGAEAEARGRGRKG